MTNHAALRYKRSPIIVLSFDHRGCFLMNILGSRKPSAIFTQDRSQEGEKAWFRLRIRRYYLQPDTYLQPRRCA